MTLAVYVAACPKVLPTRHYARVDISYGPVSVSVRLESEFYLISRVLQSL